MAWTAPRTWVTGEKVTAAQMNAHVRDNFKSGFPSDAVWAAWTPTYNNLTIGNGTVKARYIQIGKLVVCWFDFTLGSTSAVGSSPNVSCPVASSSQYGSAHYNVGPVRLQDATSTDYHGYVRVDSTSKLYMHVFNAAQTHLTQNSITATVPFTWATGDQLAFQAIYEAA